MKFYFNMKKSTTEDYPMVSDTHRGGKTRGFKDSIMVIFPLKIVIAMEIKAFQRSRIRDIT